MILYPAIDLKEGQCVRLYQGDFDAKKVYSDSPLDQARQFEEAGANWLHVVDLDGAQGKGSQTGLIIELAQTSKMKVQTGGGIRSRKKAKKLLDGGIDRIVVGSLAVREKEEVAQWLEDWPNQVVLALDIRLDEADTPRLATEGWQKEGGVTLWEVLDYYYRRDLHVLCTDIGRDGTLQGSNLDLYVEILEKYPGLQLQASGGVASLDDIRKLKVAGLPGVIVGKALYEEKFTVKEALQCSQGA